MQKIRYGKIDLTVFDRHIVDCQREIHKTHLTTNICYIKKRQMKIIGAFFIEQTILIKSRLHLVTNAMH